MEGVQPTTAAARSIGRWEPVCISLCNSKSGPLRLLRRVIQTGSHRSGRITAEIHQSGRWLPRARDGIWCAGHVDLPVSGPKLTAQGPCAEQLEPRNWQIHIPSSVGLLLFEWHTRSEGVQPTTSSVGLPLFEWHTRIEGVQPTTAGDWKSGDHWSGWWSALAMGVW